MSERPPYDETDADRVRRYLEERGRQLVDPLGADSDPNDPYFAPSLACARRQMLYAFDAKRPDDTPFRVYPAFVESHRPNAFAIELGGLHLCGMNTGLVTSVFELAAFSFSQADLFPEVGNPAAEASPRLPDNSLLGYWIADSVCTAIPAQATGIGEELIPIDPERRLMAHCLTQLMLRFVWLHEMFHGLNGHSGYIGALRGGFELHEMPDEDDLTMMEVETVLKANVPWHYLQPALELDADRSAFRTMIGLQRAGDEPFAVLAEKPLTLRLKLSHYAAMLMTFLFDQAARRRGRENDTHPVGRLRLSHLLGLPGVKGGGDESHSDTLSEFERFQAHILDLPYLEKNMNNLMPNEYLSNIEIEKILIYLLDFRFSYK